MFNNVVHIQHTMKININIYYEIIELHKKRKYIFKVKGDTKNNGQT